MAKEISQPQIKNDRQYSWLTGSKMHPLVLKEREDVKDRSFGQHRRYEFQTNGPIRPSRALWLAGLFAGMLATAFVVKKLVETFDDPKQETIAVFRDAETGLESTTVYPPASVSEEPGTEGIHASVQQRAADLQNSAPAPMQ